MYELGKVVKKTFMFTRNALYGVSSPTGQEEGQEGVTTVCEAPQVRNPEFDVPKSTGRVTELEVSAAGEAYQMEECSAYGANN